MGLSLSGGADSVFAFGRLEVPLREVKALTGDSGGPCFREDTAGQRWLAGIISYSKTIDGELITIFTSTFHHRAWINQQKDVSARTINSP
jgi:secreted trypsin-like serine protease